MKRTKTANNETRATRTGEWIYGLGGRRFLMTMGAGFTNTALFLIGALSESGYITLTSMTVGAYLLSNTAESMKNGADNPKSPPR